MGIPQKKLKSFYEKNKHRKCRLCNYVSCIMQIDKLNYYKQVQVTHSS